MFIRNEVCNVKQQTIKSGDNDTVVAGGMEICLQYLTILSKGEWSKTRRYELIDGMVRMATDYIKIHMGNY